MAQLRDWFFDADKYATESAYDKNIAGLNKCIESGDTPTMDYYLRNTTSEERKYWADHKHNPVEKAFAKGDVEIFKAVLGNDDPNVTDVYTYTEGSGSYTRTYTVKTPYLWKAIDEGKKDIARFLAEHPQTNIQYQGTRDKSALELACEKGLISIVITLANRMADIRRAESEQKLVESAMFDKEAQQLSELDLQDGVYRLPDPPKHVIPVNRPS